MTNEKATDKNNLPEEKSSKCRSGKMIKKWYKA
jgi:hypothetical protein